MVRPSHPRTIKLWHCQKENASLNLFFCHTTDSIREERYRLTTPAAQKGPHKKKICQAPGQELLLPSMSKRSTCTFPRLLVITAGRNDLYPLCPCSQMTHGVSIVVEGTEALLPPPSDKCKPCTPPPFLICSRFWMSVFHLCRYPLRHFRVLLWQVQPVGSLFMESRWWGRVCGWIMLNGVCHHNRHGGGCCGSVVRTLGLFLPPSPVHEVFCLSRVVLILFPWMVYGSLFCLFTMSAVILRSGASP